MKNIINNIMNKLLNTRHMIAFITTLTLCYLCVVRDKEMFTVFVTVYMVILGYFFTASKKEEKK